MTLGERIRNRRRALRMTQHELAKLLGVTPQHVSALEKDKRVPSLSSLGRVGEALGVTLDFLIAGKEGLVTDTIPAIKADTRLGIEVKKALITLVQALRSKTTEDQPQK